MDFVYCYIPIPTYNQTDNLTSPKNLTVMVITITRDVHIMHATVATMHRVLKCILIKIREIYIIKNECDSLNIFNIKLHDHPV